MSSSTSNSDRRPVRRTAWRVEAFLVLVFVAMEVFTRTVLLPHSKDFARFAGYAERAERLVGQTGFRVALVGSSATERGVLAEQLEEKLSTLSGHRVHVDTFVADRAEIITCHHMIKHYFWRRDLRPDVIIVTFFDSGLEDRPPMDLGRLAYFFTDAEDFSEMSDIDLPTVPDRAEFLLSTVWATYAARDRIKSRTLSVLVPNYQEIAGELNGAQFRHRKGDGTAAAPCHRALKRFLALAKRHQTKVCFVAFPPRKRAGDASYDLNPESLRLIREGGMQFLDLREVPGLYAEHYRDRMHLTPRGAAIYTNHLAKAIAALRLG